MGEIDLTPISRRGESDGLTPTPLPREMGLRI